MPARRYDLLALDLDGTTLRPDATLSPAVVAAVARATAAGVRVVLATARPPRAALVYHRQLALDTPLVTYNGSMLVDPDGNTLEHTPLKPGVGPSIVAAARDHDPDCIVHVEAEDRWLTDRHDPQLTVASAEAFPPDHIGPLDSFIHGPITKLMLLTPDNKLAALHDVVQSRFAEQTSVLICDTHMLQCVDPAVDKATAVARIANRLGIPAQRSAAIGDAPNDLGMIRWAALGLAVGNAWPELIDAADHAVATNAHDGVAEAIDRYIVS